MGRPDRHHRGPPAVVRVGPRPADPLRPRVQRERGRPVAGRWSDPRGQGGRGRERRGVVAAACHRAGAAPIPAGTGTVRRCSADPGGCRSARIDGGARRGSGSPPARAEPPSAADRVSPGTRLSAADQRESAESTRMLASRSSTDRRARPCVEVSL